MTNDESEAGCLDALKCLFNKMSSDYLRVPDKLRPFLEYWTSNDDENVKNMSEEYDKLANWIEQSNRTKHITAIIDSVENLQIKFETSTQLDPIFGRMSIPKRKHIANILRQFSLIPDVFGKGGCVMQNIQDALVFYRTVFGLDCFGPIKNKCSNQVKYPNLKKFLDYYLGLRMRFCLDEFEGRLKKFKEKHEKLFEPMKSDMDRLMSKTHVFLLTRGDSQKQDLVETARKFSHLPEMDEYTRSEYIEPEDYADIVASKTCKPLAEDSSSSLGVLVLAQAFAGEYLDKKKALIDDDTLKTLEYTRICHVYLRSKNT